MLISKANGPPSEKTGWRGAEWRASFLTSFWCLFALSSLHRLLLCFDYYVANVGLTYAPVNRFHGALLWVEKFGEATLLGLSQDVLFSLVAAVPLAFAGRWVRLTLLAVLSAFLATNTEHVAVNFSNIDLTTAHIAFSPVFVRAHLTTGVLKIALLLFAVSLCTWGLLRIRVFRRLGAVLLPVLIFLAILLPYKVSFVQPLWLQAHPLFPSGASSGAEPDNREFDVAALQPTPMAGPYAPKHNVLLIYLEGLSGHSLNIGDMEHFARAAETGVQFTRYMGTQLITANGLYSTLTGEFPNFVSGKLKWEDIDPGGEIAAKALPARLRALGYHTAFLQSADLKYMSKGEMLPRLGFEVVKGEAFWDDAYSTNGWGIDDRALFENVVEYVSGLEPGQPWFVSVLTTGTHSPYNLPPDFLPDHESNRYRALRYTDMAIERLLELLDARGLLENTVVILTSDESRERIFSGALQSEIALNWLPLVVLHPGRKAMRFDFPIGSHMLPEIVLTVAGDFDESQIEALHVPETPVVFGNTYSDRLYWFEPEKALLLGCSTRGFVCAEFTGVADPVTAADVALERVRYFPELEQLITASEREN